MRPGVALGAGEGVKVAAASVEAGPVTVRLGAADGDTAIEAVGVRGRVAAGGTGDTGVGGVAVAQPTRTARPAAKASVSRQGLKIVRPPIVIAPAVSPPEGDKSDRNDRLLLITLFLPLPRFQNLPARRADRDDQPGAHRQLLQ